MDLWKLSVSCTCGLDNFGACLLVRALIFGGRNYRNAEKVFQVLDEYKGSITMVIHGACVEKSSDRLSGADKWAEMWAIHRQVPYVGVPAKWLDQGNSAGPKRNSLMLKFKPKIAFEFPGGTGTADMRRKVLASGIDLVTTND